jgi:hypothetical protein
VKETGCLLMEDGFVEDKLEELRAWLMSHWLIFQYGYNTA